jgi:hypothetical protein
MSCHNLGGLCDSVTVQYLNRSGLAEEGIEVTIINVGVESSDEGNEAKVNVRSQVRVGATDIGGCMVKYKRLS